MKNHYEILNLKPNASHEEIEKAWEKLSEEYDPLKVINSPMYEFAEKRFQALTEAYEILSDPKKKKMYDAQLTSGQSQIKKLNITKATEQKNNKSIFYIVAGAILALIIIFVVIQGNANNISGHWYADNSNRDHLVIDKNGYFSSEFLGSGRYELNSKEITFSNGFEVIEAKITKIDGKKALYCPEFNLIYTKE